MGIGRESAELRPLRARDRGYDVCLIPVRIRHESTAADMFQRRGCIVHIQMILSASSVEAVSEEDGH
jgi:hypothetical protein